MLLVNNLAFIRNNKTIFKNLNISLTPNKFVQIKGRNGVGKTTLIKTLCQIILQAKGDIYWEGKNIKKNYENYFNNLTLIMDTNTSKKEMTINENIKFWKNLFASKIHNDVIKGVLDILGINYKNDVMVKHLSFGEIRKLEMVRLIIEQKKLWILDEPYMGLDITTIDILNETFKNHIQSHGMVIIASHYQPEIAGIETIELEAYQ